MTDLLMLRRVRLSPTYSSTSLHESSAPKVASHSLILSPSSRLHVMAGLCYLDIQTSPVNDYDKIG